MMFYLTLPVLAEEVKPQAVFIWIDEPQQSVFEKDPSVVGKLHLEDGILNPLTVIETGLRNLPQSTLTFRCFRGDIVSDEDIHRESYFQSNGG